MLFVLCDLALPWNLELTTSVLERQGSKNTRGWPAVQNHHTLSARETESDEAIYDPQWILNRTTNVGKWAFRIAQPLRSQMTDGDCWSCKLSQLLDIQSQTNHHETSIWMKRIVRMSFSRGSYIFKTEDWRLIILEFAHPMDVFLRVSCDLWLWQLEYLDSVGNTLCVYDQRLITRRD